MHWTAFTDLRNLLRTFTFVISFKVFIFLYFCSSAGWAIHTSWSSGVCVYAWMVTRVKEIATAAMHTESCMHRPTGGPKIGTQLLYALTLPNVNRFLKLFHCQNHEKICNNTIIKDPTTPQVCHYITLWNVKCLKSNGWKQDDFCNNTYKN